MPEQDPPRRSSRFQPGQSGNYKGRPRKPKGQQSDSSLDVVLGQSVSISIGGVNRRVSVEDALMHKTLQDAFAGDRMATRTVLKVIFQREAERPQNSQFPRILARHIHPADVDDALVFLNIATEASDRSREGGRRYLQFEPWAVTSALARKKMGHLRYEDIKELKGNTRDPEAVDWPYGDDA